jgi:hypothetical protein
LKSLASSALAISLLAVCAFAQNNPVPQIVGPVHPDAVPPGGGDFTLSVYGANFVPGAVVNWNYQPRSTTYISGHELQAQILSRDIAKNTAGYISVTNPAPGGGSSSASWAQVEVHDPISTFNVEPWLYYQFAPQLSSAADFTHDGVLDLLGQYFGLALDLGLGGGTFRPESYVDRSYYTPFQFAYGDFNGDGNLDVVDASFLNLEHGGLITHMNVELGDGTGNFTSATPIVSQWDDLAYVQVADFNQDGNLDLVTSGGTLSVYLGNGDATFRHTAHYPYPSEGLGLQAVGDFNGDGKLDIILESPFMSIGQGDDIGITLYFLEGKGDGTFKTPVKIASFPNARVCAGGLYGGAVQLSDFNGDGMLDLAFCNQAQVGVMLGNGDGTFQPPTFYTADPTGQGLFTFALGDINSDGKPDLIVSQYHTGYTSPSVVFLGNGDGTFQAQQTLSSGSAAGEGAVVVGDFNSDGLLDVIFVNELGMFVSLQQ